MSDIVDSRPIFRRLFERVFPKAPDFFTLLAEQCVLVGQTSSRLVEFMETGDMEIGKLIKQDEHDADVIKIRNIHILNEAFSTPIDREDIYRAINDLDEIVNYCKSTVNEMDVLGIKPGKHDLEMAMRLHEGVVALINGFGKLKISPSAAATDADQSRGGAGLRRAQGQPHHRRRPQAKAGRPRRFCR